MTSRTLIITALFLSLNGLSAAAVAQTSAQPWLSDRRIGEGGGIRTGNLEFHPGVAGEVGYDSNYFQNSGQEDATHNEPIVPTLRFRLTPSLSLSTLNQQRNTAAGGDARPKATFRLSAAATYNELWAADEEYADNISDQRNLGGNIGSVLALFPEDPWGADLLANFGRVVQPGNDPGISAGFNRNTVDAGAGVNWKPGGGLFDWRLGYGMTYQFFDDSDFSSQNSTTHNVSTRGRWRFFPRTALIYLGQAEFINYSDSTSRQNGSSPISASLGLNGLAADHFGLLVMAGWKSTFYENSPGVPVNNYDSFIGQAEMSWFLMPQPKLEPKGASVGLSSITTGYLRDIRNSLLGDYYQRDRIYGNFSYFAGGVFLMTFSTGYSLISHPETRFSATELQFAAFSENRVDATAFGEYRSTDTFALNATLRYNGSLNSTDIVAIPGRSDQDNVQFSRFEAYLGARWFY